MSFLVIRTAVRFLACLSDICFTCMRPRIYCTCRKAGTR